MPFPFGIKYVLPIVANLFEMMGSILSVSMYSSEKSVNFHSYQLLMLTHHIQIQYFQRTLILRRVFGIYYPLIFCIRQRVCFWCVLWEFSFLPFNKFCIILVCFDMPHTGPLV